MVAISSQITSLTIIQSTIYSDADQIKHQSSASPAFVRGIHRWPVHSPHKWPVTRNMFPFDDVIIYSFVMDCTRIWHDRLHPYMIKYVYLWLMSNHIYHRNTTLEPVFIPLLYFIFFLAESLSTYIMLHEDCVHLSKTSGAYMSRSTMASLVRWWIVAFFGDKSSYHFFPIVHWIVGIRYRWNLNSNKKLHTRKWNWKCCLCLTVFTVSYRCDMRRCICINGFLLQNLRF